MKTAIFFTFTLLFCQIFTKPLEFQVAGLEDKSNHEEIDRIPRNIHQRQHHVFDPLEIEFDLDKVQKDLNLSKSKSDYQIIDMKDSRFAKSKNDLEPIDDRKITSRNEAKTT